MEIECNKEKPQTNHDAKYIWTVYAVCMFKNKPNDDNDVDNNNHNDNDEDKLN